MRRGVLPQATKKLKTGEAYSFIRLRTVERVRLQPNPDSLEINFGFVRSLNLPICSNLPNPRRPDVEAVP